jgi:hypothetical protein
LILFVDGSSKAELQIAWDASSGEGEVMLECSAANSIFSLSMATRSSASASVSVSLSRVVAAVSVKSYNGPGEERNPSPQLQLDGTIVKRSHLGLQLEP